MAAAEEDELDQDELDAFGLGDFFLMDDDDLPVLPQYFYDFPPFETELGLNVYPDFPNSPFRAMRPPPQDLQTRAQIEDEKRHLEEQLRLYLDNYDDGRMGDAMVVEPIIQEIKDEISLLNRRLNVADTPYVSKKDKGLRGNGLKMRPLHGNGFKKTISIRKIKH
jgi:hypothetical protein